MTREERILKRIAKLQKQFDDEVKALEQDGYNITVQHGTGDDKLNIEQL